LAEASRPSCIGGDFHPFGAAIARLSGVDALTIGTPIATAQERMLGCFINLLTLPVRLRPDMGFRDLVGQMKASTLWAFEHSDIGFSDVVSALGARQDRLRPPLFQAMIELANMPVGGLAIDGLAVTDLPFEHGTSEFELNLILRETAEGLSGWLIYRTALFDRGQADRIFCAFRDMLANGLATPDTPILGA
jgi:non-ribosomal peptide synthetase component F